MSNAKINSGARTTGLIILILVVGTLAAYWPVRGFEFVNCDDTDYVYQNPRVQQGLTWGSAGWAFRTTFNSNWHPLTWLSHMLDYQLYGLKPGGHHLTNLFLHVANVLLLFHVLRRMTGGTWRSAFAAALFAWHPLHVESVAWVAERKDVLSTFFWMLTLWAYSRYVQSFRPKFFYGLALVFFILGLMSKPMLVTLPCVLLLLDYWPLTRNAEAGVRRLILEKLPFFGLAAAASVVTFLAQNNAGSVMSFQAMPLPLRIENALVSYVNYLGQFFWPGKMALFYPYPNSIPTWEIAGAALLLAGLTLAAIRWARKSPWLVVGWFWFLGTLVPVIGLVQVGIQARADRYTYIPYIGLSLMLAWGVSALATQWRLPRPALAWAAALALLGCFISTRAQMACWHDSRMLFAHAVEVTPDNYAAHNNLGSILATAGNLDDAQAHFAEAVRLKPAYDQARYNLGNALGIKGRLDEAVSEYQESIRLNPKIADKYNQLGRVYVRQHKLDEGIAMFSKAVELNPQYEPAHYSLGVSYLVKGKTAEAIAELKIAVQLAPGDANAQKKLAAILSGAPDQSVLNYRTQANLPAN